MTEARTSVFVEKALQRRFKKYDAARKAGKIGWTRTLVEMAERELSRCEAETEKEKVSA